jgi:sec-independent protein translocase protein TatA
MGLPGLESPTHILLVLVVVVLLFGARRLPELGKSLGRGISEFKEGLNFKDEPAGGERPKEALEGERAGAAPVADGGGARVTTSEGEKAHGERRQ